MNEFYYEFARESKRIKAMVDKLRDRDRQNLPFEGDDPFSPMVLWLSGLKWFPDYPWENPLKDEAIARGFKRAGIDPKTLEKIKVPSWKTGTFERMLSGRPNIRTFNPGDALKVTEQAIKFDWRLSDAELREEFERIIRHRPSEYKHLANAADEQLPALSFGSPAGFKLPFKMSSALEWLKVYKERKKGKLWKQLDKGSNPKEQYNNAAAILCWFDGDKKAEIKRVFK